MNTRPETRDASSHFEPGPPVTEEEEQLKQRAEAWLQAFDDALVSHDQAAIRSLFEEDSHWRDLAAFTWNVGSVSGAGEIEALFSRRLDEIKPANIRLAPHLRAPRWVARSGRRVCEVYFLFDTAVGFGTGVVRLVPSAEDRDDLRAWILLTRLDGLKGFGPPEPGTRPAGVGYDRHDTTKNWADHRRDQQAFADRDPEVLVVGGGHAGVFSAVHLTRLGVDTLIIDRFPRIGDNWRTRYRSLALHNKTDMVHFPLMPFPANFPEYLPKDLLANWFESYVQSMQLNFWTSTEFLGGSFDDGRWSVRIRCADGSERVMHPRHVVIATGGVGGTPNVPNLPGIKEFTGPVVHTKEFQSGADYAHQNVLVVGVGTSGHDVAFDLHQHGATVSMLQRNPTTVINLETSNMSYPQFTEPNMPLEEADLVSLSSFILPVMRESFKQLTATTTAVDQPLLDRLEAAGMQLDNGEGGTGWMMKFYERGGGYYINVGCSELVAEGAISVIQSTDVDTFTSDGLQLTDGTSRPYDAIVLATGYQNQQVEVRRFFGDEIADRVGPISGFDEGGELRNAYKPTRQPGLWFVVSGIAAVRAHTVHLAALIKADLEGLIS